MPLRATSTASARVNPTTPCFDALVGAEGIYLFDTEGRRLMDFHGNSVHQVGYGHPKVVAAVKA